MILMIHLVLSVIHNGIRFLCNPNCIKIYICIPYLTEQVKQKTKGREYSEANSLNSGQYAQAAVDYWFGNLVETSNVKVAAC